MPDDPEITGPLPPPGNPFPPKNPPPSSAVVVAKEPSGFQQWLRGLISVAVSSGAGGVTVGIVDPNTFNVHAGLPKLLETCGVLALIHVALYLQKSPIWDAAVQVNAPSADTVNVTNQQP
jgi:hypothetical protein